MLAIASVARLVEREEESMTIIAILSAVGAYGGLYVALGERSPWVPLFAALVLTFLSYAAARMVGVEATTVNKMASGSRHSTMRAISHRIARSLSVSAPTSSAT
jgi:hypothetical protein